MQTEEEWNRAFERLLPVISIGIGGIGIALTIMTLTRANSLGRRVYYQDGQIMVGVRYGQWHDLRDFVQPSNPDILAILSQYGPDYWALFDYVCSEIQYRTDPIEFFQFPSETIDRGFGDCEDTTLLTCSLLRNFTNAYAVLGNYRGYGHAWCQLDGQILETTYTRARFVPDPQDYCAYVLFNDQEVIELWPGALGEIFGLKRDELSKLTLMAGVTEEVAPECPSCLPFLGVGLVMGGIIGTGFAMVLQKDG